jgi:hypothetical protein
MGRAKTPRKTHRAVKITPVLRKNNATDQDSYPDQGRIDVSFKKARMIGPRSCHEHFQRDEL